MMRQPFQDPPAFRPALGQWGETALKSVILATCGICFLLYLAVHLSTWHEGVFPISHTLTPVVVAALLALWCMSRSWISLASLVWIGGLALSITLAVFLLNKAELGFLYMLLPIYAALLMPRPFSLVVFLLLNIQLYLLSVLWPAQFPLRAHLPVILFGSAISLVVVWLTRHSFLALLNWYMAEYQRGRSELEADRRQRVALAEVQEDLIQANQELARLSERLKVMTRVAEEARRAKEEFVANVSHELRTPLNMIIGFTEMIQRSPQIYGGKLSPVLLADISSIQRNSSHLARLIDDVLDLSRMDSGLNVISPELVALSEIVHESVEVVGALYKSKNLYLEVSLPPDLPPVYCDRTRIRQVLINLLSNSGRFTEQGGVMVEARREPGQVVVSVRDTGPGIAPENQQRIFEPFQQEDGSIRRKYGGTGLGLAISRRLIELHDGSMWLESSPKGTTIFFSLPFQSPESDLELHKVTRWFDPQGTREYLLRSRSFKAPRPTAQPRFLVVDQPDRPLYRAFKRALPEADVESLADRDLGEVDIDSTSTQAVVINQASYTGMLDPTGTFQALPPGVPVFTCQVDGEEAAARRLGVVKYLTKPVKREHLLDTLALFDEEVQTVLLVDDNQELLQLYARMILSAERKYRVLQTTSGARALSMMRDRHPDVVFLDLMMNTIDGYGVLKMKAEDPAIRGIPVVAVTSMEINQQTGNWLSFVVQQPMNQGELARLVHRLSTVLYRGEAAQSPLTGSTPGSANRA